MKKKMYIYEIDIPVSEYWVMEVEASSYKQALELVKKGGCDQIYSMAAHVGRTKPRLIEKKKVK